jgi:hypothetical protein
MSVVAFGMVENTTERKTFTTPIKRLQIRADASDIIVRGGNSGSVQVIAKLESSFATPKHSETLIDGVLEVTSDCPDSGFMYTCSVNYEVFVPPGMAVDAHTSAGDVNIRNTGGAVTATSNIGDVEVRGAAGPIEMTTNSGEVTGVALTAGTVVAESDIGDLRLSFHRTPDRVSAHTDTGDVRVLVPADGTTYKVTADTGTGDESVQVPVNSGSAHSLDLRSGIGDVRAGLTGND